ncbi:hypothetical protein Poly30_45610 [Planctomycetes bacterium Poly30]|uniref:Lipoprotein n=1 Tax=Saltatorellus ferox TaxID=2528018 RepID=A0A518EY36_9BACT|nr:hypothetical protein Poly30_45610 [Planctomycetes bacterium Poly30]
MHTPDYRALVASSILAAGLSSCGEPDRPVDVEVWHGATQRVGHLGDAQDDFNLMGVVSGTEFAYTVNGGPPEPLVVSFDDFGFRRLGAAGHFNVDVPITSLDPGDNLIEISVKSDQGELTARTTVHRALEGSAELPYRIDWSEVAHPQDVGQIVDGRWQLEADGLRSEEPLYDRLFLIGNRTWEDYRITTTVTVHRVPEVTGPRSGGSGLGFIFRFTGHTVSPPRFPEARPKWGYQPFGAITWLRWSKAQPAAAPVRQFYRGDKDESKDAGPLSPFEIGAAYGMTAECVTSEKDPNTTTYRLRVWPSDRTEPAGWDYEIEQTSETALRAGGVALVAHHVNVTFGDVSITPMTGTR